MLKIDRSFISAIAANPQSRALIQTLVQLGTTLGIETLAEGIENRIQLAALQDEHCDSGQGFLFSRPLDVDAMNAFLKACLVVRRPNQLAGSTGVRVDAFPSGDERA